MKMKRMNFEILNDDLSTHILSIIISGDKPELMINEMVTNANESNSETVQVSQDQTYALYLSLHKIYSVKP
jgi:hypothetical protein